MSPETSNSINFLRGLAILFVMAIHVCGNAYGMTTFGSLYWVNVSIHALLHGIAVPLFLVISGLVLASKYPSGFPVRDFYFKRLQTILIPYIVFSAIYIIAFGFVNGFPTTGEIIHKLLVGGAAEHFWYFRLIVELYLVYPALIWAYESFEDNNKEWVFLAVLLGWQILTMTVGGPQFSRWWFYFGVGMYIGRRGLRLNIKNSVIESIGKLSYGIYIVHILFLALSVRLISFCGITKDDLWFYILSFSLTLFLSYLSLQLFHLTKGVLNGNSSCRNRNHSRPITTV